MSAYYNEIDPFAADWLRNLIGAGLIADGVVDTRSISDVRPEELFEFTQCHFFAGIGVWSHALRGAGWDDDRPVWTGSCPCQPFSGAGKREGIADKRHLFPDWFHLIRECRPATIFGEQVASKDGLGWLDLVQADMEGEGYAFAPFDLCASGFGAPHIRQRLWFVAHSDHTGSQGRISGWPHSERQDQHGHIGCGGTVDGMAHSECNQQRSGRGTGREGQAGHECGVEPSGRGEIGGMDNAGGIGRDAGRHGNYGGDVRIEFDATVEDVGLAHSSSSGRQYEPSVKSPRVQSQEIGNEERRPELGGHGSSLGSGAKTNGVWRDADWLYCRDGKWRPVEPSTFPLANGIAGRVGRCRAYGNAIVSEVAQGLISSFMEGERDGTI